MHTRKLKLGKHKLGMVGLLLLFLLMGMQGRAGAQTLVKSTDWTAAPTTAAGAAGSTLYDGWLDVAGNLASVSGSALQIANVSNPWAGSDVLLRPVGENMRDGQSVIEWTASATSMSHIAAARWTGTNTCYFANVFGASVSPSFYLYRDAAGTITQVGSTGSSTSATVGDRLRATLAVTGASPATLTMTLYDVTTSTTLGTATTTDSTGPQVAGQWGVVGGSGTAVSYLRTATFSTAAPLSVSPSSLTASTSGNAVTLTDPSIVAGTTFSLSSTGTGAAITAGGTATGSGSAVLTVSAGTAGTITYSDSADAATATQPVTSATVTTAVTSANLYFSPYNWFSVGGSGAMQNNNVRATGTTSVTTANPGAYLKLAPVSSTSAGTVSLTLDTAPLSGVPSANCPTLCWSVDGGAMQSALLASGVNTLSLAGSLSAASHTVQVWLRSVTLTSTSAMGDRWTYSATAPTGASVVKILNVQTDGGTTLAAPTIRPNTMLWLGDSKAEGADAVGSANGPNDQDSTVTFVPLVAQAYNAEVGVLGWSSQGYEQAGYGNVPALSSAWNSYFSGQSRLIGGLLSPAPTYIVSTHGRNGATVAGDITALSAALRTAAPSAKTFFAVPDDLFAESAITSGANTAHASDANTFLIDAGVNFMSPLTSNDTVHLNGLRGHPRYAAALTQMIQAKLGGTSTVIKRRIQ